MIMSSLCDYVDACTLVQETITVTGARDAAAAAWKKQRCNI